MLLDCEDIRRRVRGVILSGACSSSALCAADYLQKAGLDVWAVSGLLTNSPLFMREFSSLSSIPLVSSRAGAGQLARIVMKKAAVTEPAKRPREAAAQMAVAQVAVAQVDS
jgi:hypothetical protein